MKAGHFLATESGIEFDLTERERIRWALLDYMKEHKIGTPHLAERIKKSHPREMTIPLKTLQRFLGRLKPLPEGATEDEIERAKPRRTHDMALTICKVFVEKLPNKPTAMQALGESLYAVYGHHPGFRIGVHSVSAHEIVISEFTVLTPISLAQAYKFMLTKETTPYPRHRIYDGALVATGSNDYLVISKDRLMRTVRVHALHPRSTGADYHGIVYDNGPVQDGGIEYVLLPTSVTSDFGKSVDD